MAEHTRPRIPIPSRLPDSRAVVGGLLVALAVGLTLRANAAADTPPTTRYLVAATDLDVGDRVAVGDVTEVAVELPEPQRRQAIASGEDLIGAVALGPVRQGQLLAAADLLRAPEGVADPVLELSVPIPSERALDGRLAPGELVDLLATTGTGADATTEIVASSARLLAVSRPDDSIAGLGTVVLTVAVNDVDTALAIAHAGATAELTVIRGATP